jgi:anti-sigma B factor antagonist
LEPNEQIEVLQGMLAVRRERHDGTCVVALCGELDLANAAAAQAEMTAALEADDSPVVIDLRKLEFIDSTGIAVLITAVAQAGDGRLSFRPSDSPAVRRVLALTGVDQRLPPAPS